MVAGFKPLEMMSERGRLRQSRKKTLIEIEAYTVPKPDLVQAVLRIVRRTAGHLGLSASDINESDFVVHDRLTGPAYREVDPLTVNSMKEVAATEGILLDP
jgi:1-aminocyclopropane-1-carboxylate deaminase/D-cysteine desulfhydrase-like pyridoxal-dependent ACC family enzyme